MSERTPPGGGALAALIAALAALSRMLGNDLALARLEARRAADDLGRGLLHLALGLLLALVALMVLADAAVEGALALGLHPVWARLLVGGALLLLALVLLQFGRLRLRVANLMPWRTMRSLRRNLAALVAALTGRAP